MAGKRFLPEKEKALTGPEPVNIINGTTKNVCGQTARACTGFDGGLEVGEAIRSGTLR